MGRGGGIFFLIAASDSFWGGMVVELLLNCDNSSSIVVGRFFLFLFCRRYRCSAYVINRALSLHCLV